MRVCAYALQGPPTGVRGDALARVRRQLPPPSHAWNCLFISCPLTWDHSLETTGCAVRALPFPPVHRVLH